MAALQTLTRWLLSRRLHRRGWKRWRPPRKPLQKRLQDNRLRKSQQRRPQKRLRMRTSRLALMFVNVVGLLKCILAMKLKLKMHYAHILIRVIVPDGLASFTKM